MPAADQALLALMLQHSRDSRISSAALVVARVQELLQARPAAPKVHFSAAVVAAAAVARATHSGPRMALQPVDMNTQ
jgi:hypothetical protein